VRPSLRLAAVLALGALALSATYVLLARAPHTHTDGAGPLGSIGSPSHQALGTDPSTGVREWTYGVPLCVMDPKVSATVHMVEPTQSVGTDFRVRRVLIRAFLETQTHRPIVGVEGYPPPVSEVPDELVQADGYVVRSQCSAGDQGSYTELLIGLEMTGPDGGGWNGIDISYTSQGQERTLHLDQDLLICGPAVQRDAAVKADCSDVPSATPQATR
jgi:hypothetical protein